ncbi:MAG: molybdopterin-dependent oxidoreductase, partial [Pseudomonadota bacterium]|nr:molybdopterin-dependent oxidoreductase [Pseudomonadota bacterium]
DAIARKLKAAGGKKTGAIIGDLAAAEEVFALKSLMDALGSPHMDCRQDGAKLATDQGRSGYLFNSGIQGIDEADAILLVGADPRMEAAVLNARIRKRYRSGGVAIALIGVNADLTYPYDYLGAGPDTLQDLVAGKLDFHKTLKRSKQPMVIVGQSAFARPEGAAIVALAATLAHDTGVISKGWNGFNILHTAASRVGALDLGFLPAKGGLDVEGMVKAAGEGKLDAVYLLGADEIDMDALGKAFVIYQGSHGDKGAHRADVILPGAAYTEKSGTFVNTEGRPQMTARAVFPPGQAREDWAIVRALSGKLEMPLPFDNLNALRSRMYQAAPHLAALDSIAPASNDAIKALAKAGGKVTSKAFTPAIADFYLTNPIARASATMAQMSALVSANRKKATGTHG